MPTWQDERGASQGFVGVARLRQEMRGSKRHHVQDPDVSSPSVPPVFVVRPTRPLMPLMVEVFTGAAEHCAIVHE